MIIPNTFPSPELIDIHRPLAGAPEAQEAQHVLGGAEEQEAALDVNVLHEEQHGVHDLLRPLRSSQPGQNACREFFTVVLVCL